MPENDDAVEVEEEEEQPTQNASPLDDPEWLTDAYHGDAISEGGATQEEIGEEVGVTSSTVSHYMKKHEIDTRQNVIVDDRLDDPEWLENAYWGDSVSEGGATMQEIADEVGCSDGTVMRRLHEHDIEVRRSTVGESADDEDDEEDSEESSDEEPEEDSEESSDDEE